MNQRASYLRRWAAKSKQNRELRESMRILVARYAAQDAVIKKMEAETRRYIAEGKHE